MLDYQVSGKMVFDPPSFTKKHNSQSSWKRTAFVDLSHTCISDMWRWYFKKRFGLSLNPPIRGTHLTVVNDKLEDLELWNQVKSKYDGREFALSFPKNSIRGNDKHWWFKLKDGLPMGLVGIRKELNLSPQPYFPAHITIGLVNNRNQVQSDAVRTELIRQAHSLIG